MSGFDISYCGLFLEGEKGGGGEGGWVVTHQRS